MLKNLSQKISKFFRIAVEGATTDGRNIDRNLIIQMAKNFDPKTYGARIWLEHFRGTLPDGPFRAYGDVLALKAEEVEIKGEKKMALYAQIAPTEDLIAMVQKKQKIYTSMEVNPNFAKSGEAYLVGLGVTDSPASLGTEILAFAAQASPAANPLAGKKSSPDTLFSEAVEVDLEFEDVQKHSERPLLDKVKALVNKFSGKEASDDARFNDIQEATTLLLSHVASQSEKLEQVFQHIDTLENRLKASDDAFSSLKAQLEASPSGLPERPSATGGTGEVRTDC